MKLESVDKLVANVLEQENRLNLALSALSRTASIMVGFKVSACLCEGGEIEFRKDDDFDEAFQHISLEELKKMSQNK